MAYRKTVFSRKVAPDFTQIPGGLNIGSQIIIKGRVPYDQPRFSINLQTEQAEYGECDIAFHFNPRMDDEVVVRNTFQDGWQEEERDIPYFPFTPGSKFTIRIWVGQDYYFVIVNGRDFIRYDHRLPFEDVRCLYLSEGGEYYETTIQNSCVRFCQPYDIPYRGQFTDVLRMGKALRVRGFVNDDAERFAINFNCDMDGDTIGVHFNPRQDEETVVMNSLVDGGWQEEERDQAWFPFFRGEFFDVHFVAWDGCFMIYVNEQFFTSYNFRVQPEDILFLDINGDVTLMDVEFTDPLPDDYMIEVQSGLEKSDLIVTKGFFYPEGNRFAINLLYGTSMDDDIALHFNPRRDDGEVVLNSRENGDWQDEERHDLPYPFLQFLPFQVEIVVKSNKFKIYVNGKKLGKFKARGNIEDIRGINVNGYAYIYEVKLQKRLELPFVDKLPSNLEVGSWLSFIGIPKKDADQFAINLQCGDDTEYGNDVAFHLNPRFSCEDVVRNTLEGGDWGDEERDQSEFPFEPEERFTIDILRLPEYYRVYVNGKNFIDYAHRMDAERVSHLMLTGDCNFFEPEFY